MTAARRFALLILLILLAGAGATPALAGEYVVVTCGPSFTDVNHAWVASASNPLMEAGANCPLPANEQDKYDLGLFTRPKRVANDNATVPPGAFSAMTFSAPPGATLSWINYEHHFCGGIGSGFRAGLRTGEGTWLHYSSTGLCGTFVPSPTTTALGGTTRAVLMTQCVDGPCDIGGGTFRAWASMRTIRVAVSDSTAPQISLTGGSALTPGWKSGVVDLAFTATDNVGLVYAELAHGSPLFTSDGECDFSKPRPCADLRPRFGLDTRMVPDGRQAFVVRAKDAAGNWGTKSLVVAVDNTAPLPANNAAVLGPSGWHRQNGFTVVWRNPTETDAAPISAVDFDVCPARNDRDDWTGCTHGSAAGQNIANVPSLRVPSDGDWVGRFWLRDAAGNADRRTAVFLPLRLDSAPPRLAFAPIDEDDPTRIDLRASESLSGLSRADIEIRRRGESSWLPLATTRSATGFSALLDDERLPDGTYDLRARAYDVAGNMGATERELSGREAIRAVPARIGTRIVAGQVKRVTAGGSRGRPRRTRQIIVVRPRVPYGRTIPIHGRLTTPGGNPVANANIEVWEQLALPGARSRRVAVVATNGAGRFKFKALRGPSRHLRFRYPGTAVVRARTAEVDLHVMARATLRARPKRVVNGEEITLRGRVLGGPLPTVGKLLQLQAFSRGKWLTFATPRANAVNGRWSYRYRFTSTRGTVRYRFRARVPREAGFPYDSGASRSSPVVVRGL